MVEGESTAGFVEGSDVFGGFIVAFHLNDEVSVFVGIEPALTVFEPAGQWAAMEAMSLSPL